MTRSPFDRHNRTLADDSQFTSIQNTLSTLAGQRDALATQIKMDLSRAAFAGTKIDDGAVVHELSDCQALIGASQSLAQSS